MTTPLEKAQQIIDEKSGDPEERFNALLSLLQEYTEELELKLEEMKEVAKAQWLKLHQILCGNWPHEERECYYEPPEQLKDA